MRHFIFFWLALLVGVQAADVTLVWDANPVADAITEYRMYERTATQPADVWIKVGTSTQPTLTLLNISGAAHTYAVTAANANGESDRSNTVTVPATQPSAPMNLRLLSSLAPLSRPPFVPAAGAGSFTSSTIAGMRAWWKSDAGAQKDDGIGGFTAVTSDGDYINRWQDQSGNGYDLAQPTNAYAPLYKVGIVHGLPVARMFWGASPTEIFMLSGVGTIGTIFVVASNTNASASAPAICRIDSLGSDKRGITYFPNQTTIYSGDPNEAFGSTFGNYVDGVSTWSVATGFHLISQVASVPVPSDTIVSIGYSHVNDAFYGDVAEVLLYDSALNSTDRGTVETYLRAKYGL